MNPDGTYNWEKQKGQQWFLKKAVLDYEVEDIVGFMNSPPYILLNTDMLSIRKTDGIIFLHLINTIILHRLLPMS